MTISALVLDESPVVLWGLTARQRLRRQLEEIGGIAWLDTVDAIPASGRVLLLNANYLFETRTLTGLLRQPDSVLVSPRNGHPAAAVADAPVAGAVAAWLASPSAVADPGLARLDVDRLQAFDESLRSTRPPLVEPVSTGRKDELENLLYGNAYRGVTDLVTKFVWPRPARFLVRVCAAFGITPNQVTSAAFLLVLAACWLFYEGHYATGLMAGWLMTLLDTVDGKLARVTVRSSRFGHWFDHGIDLLHPPFWYLCWGLSLADPLVWGGLDFHTQCWLLVAGYIGGRAAEGLFMLLGDCSLFTWRPFDAWFRLVTARRNPCLILLTASALIGRPDAGFVAVVAWTALTTVVLGVRLLQGWAARLQRGPLHSWLADPGVAQGVHARSFRWFGGTRGAYG